MQQPRFYSFLHRQIMIMVVLSVFPGLGYILLSWLNDSHGPAIVWYLLILAVSVWGFRLHRAFSPQQMSRTRLERWYRELRLFFYLFFILWAMIFIIYVQYDTYKLHYIAIFTQIGATTVAATLLYPDSRLFRPLIPLMTLPLMIYFSSIGEWYGYILAAFAATLGWVLYYAASGSHKLLLRTHYQSSHDHLTGLYNRQYFLERLQQALNTLQESGNHSYLLLIDLDHFKTVNDSLGHDIGDQLLQEIALRMQRPLEADQLLARLGGDEFVIIGNENADQRNNREEASALADTLLTLLKDTYVIQDHHIYISASIGIRLIEPQEQQASDLIREADIAMYEVKAAGRDGTILFDENISQGIEKHLEIERRLHFAIEKDEISLHYQPQFNSELQVIGAEALVRWNSETLGAVSPAEFIPIAEQTGLIIELGNQILRDSFHTLRHWHDSGMTLEQFSVNISVRQLTHHSFVDTVRHLIGQHLDEGLCHKVIFEITETVVAEDIERVVSTMRELHGLGIRFSMDDFGTGYSSLNYLKRLPIDELKIDRSFVSDLTTDDDDQAMVITILSIARFFGLKVVAEGVESEAQLTFLQGYACEVFQGFYLARPMPQGEFEQFCRQNHALGEGEAEGG
jgi:diguanylate cyclase (GGDEF)-like protein